MEDTSFFLFLHVWLPCVGAAGVCGRQLAMGAACSVLWEAVCSWVFFRQGVHKFGKYNPG